MIVGAKRIVGFMGVCGWMAAGFGCVVPVDDTDAALDNDVEEVEQELTPGDATNSDGLGSDPGGTNAVPAELGGGTPGREDNKSVDPQPDPWHLVPMHKPGKGGVGDEEPMPDPDHHDR